MERRIVNGIGRCCRIAGFCRQIAKGIVAELGNVSRAINHLQQIPPARLVVTCGFRIVIHIAQGKQRLQLRRLCFAQGVLVFTDLEARSIILSIAQRQAQRPILIGIGVDHPPTPGTGLRDQVIGIVVGILGNIAVVVHALEQVASAIVFKMTGKQLAQRQDIGLGRCRHQEPI